MPLQRSYSQPILTQTRTLVKKYKLRNVYERVIPGIKVEDIPKTITCELFLFPPQLFESTQSLHKI